MVAKDFRILAWNTLRGKWKTAVIAGLIAALLGGTVIGSGGGLQLDLDEEQLRAIFYRITGGQGDFWAFVSSIMPVLLGLVTIATVWSIAAFILGGAVSFGYAQFNLDIVDGKDPSVSTLFSRLSKIKSGIAMQLLTTLYIILWMLLFIIPGIIAGYRYAMTPYILAENPDMGVKEAIGASKKLMKGNKFRLFCLHLSFIGWYLLTPLTLGILSLWVRPYTEAANAAFYREISDTKPDKMKEEISTGSDDWSYGSSWGAES